MDTSRLGRGEMIAVVSAIVLLLVMFIFSWFSVDFGDGLGIGAVGVDTTANAWQAFGFIDIILFVTILVAVGLAVMKANSQSANLPVAGSALVAGLGILSTLLLLFRIISPPGAGDIPDGVDIGIGRGIGVFLGLLLAAGIAYGGYLSMQEEGTSFGDQADRLQNKGGSGTGAGGTGTGGGTPPPPPPPPPRDPGSTPPPAV